MSVRDYLVVDLEATCDDAGTIPREQTEIIEIGAVRVDGGSLEPTDEFQTFIKPVRHPTLTPFCVELTSITQDDVDAAPSFAEAMAAMARFIGDRAPLFCSWGDYDRKQLAHDATHHRVRVPLGPQHLNLKQAFSDALGHKKRYGMARALLRVGLPLDGTHHRGIDDARNIAKLLPYAVERRPFPPPPVGWRRRRSDPDPTASR